MKKFIVASLGLGLSLGGFLFTIFLILKLIKLIDWSWWRVTMPLWAGVILAFIIMIIATIVLTIKYKR
jgi:uncharacterized protein (DUF983 family)